MILRNLCRVCNDQIVVMIEVRLFLTFLWMYDVSILHATLHLLAVELPCTFCGFGRKIPTYYLKHRYSSWRPLAMQICSNWHYKGRRGHVAHACNRGLRLLRNSPRIEELCPRIIVVCSQNLNLFYLLLSEFNLV